MVVLTRAVGRGLRTPVLVGDLPLGSYEPSDAVAVASAQRLVRAGADAVKLEGAVARACASAATGIRVMGHLGLTPQSRSALGGFRTQGRTAEAALALLADARALEAAGCFALVLEAPRFVKRYADASRTAHTGIAAFAADVRAGRFPTPRGAARP